MSRFGWAYVNSVITGAVANGPTNSVQFNSGSQVLSGSSNFTFNPATNEVILLGELTGSTLVISASVVSASTYLGIPAGGSTTPGDGDKSIQFNSGSTFSGSTNLTFDYTTNTLFLTGTLRADNLIVSSSQILKSGSTIFGDDASDTHQFTGSILGGAISGTTGQFTTITSQGSIITGSLLMSGTAYISEVDYIDFDVSASAPSHKNGRVYWNNTDGCLDVYNVEADITLQVGQENWTRIRNNTGTTITNGTVVRIIGAQGDAPTVERAQSIAKSGSINVDTQILGVATHDIEDSSFGYVTTQGLVRGLNTNAFADGDTLFVGTGSAGALQNTAPVAPYEIIPVGVCVKAGPGASGIIYVAVQQPIDFPDLSSVFVSGNYAYGDIWTYVSSSNTGYWIHTNTLSGSYTITGSLTATATISGSTGLFGVVTSSAYSGGSFVGTTISGTTGQFTTITGSTIISNLLRVSGTSENAIDVSSSSPAFKINQQGSGFAFIVEDQAGPDASPFVIAANGDVGIGTSIPTEKLHVIGTIKSTTTISGTTAQFTIITGSNISASNQLQVAGTSFLNGDANIGGNILGSAGFKANYATFSSSFTASSLSYFVGVSTTGSVVTASLNSATNYPAGQTLIFKDVGGNAGTNNIRIQPSGSQTIDGATSLIISSTSGSATLVSNGVDGFYIVGLT